MLCLLFAVVVVPSTCLEGDVTDAAARCTQKVDEHPAEVVVTNLEEVSERYQQSPELHIF